jgi:hypothetical protein
MRHRGARRRLVAAAATLAVVLAAAPAALADTWIPLPVSPAFMLVDDVHGQVYVTDWVLPQLSVLDHAGNPVTTVAMDSHGHSLDLVGDTLFVSLPDDASIAMIDVSTNTLDGYLEVPGQSPGMMAVAGGRAWFTHRYAPGILASVDVTDPTDFIEHPDLPGAPYLVSSDSDPDLLLTSAWASDEIGMRLSRFDMSLPDPLVATHDAGVVEVPEVVLSLDGADVYYSFVDHDLGTSGIRELDSSDMSEVDGYAAPGASEFGPLAISADGGHVAAVTRSSPSTISVFPHGASDPVRMFGVGPACNGAGTVPPQGLAFSGVNGDLLAITGLERTLLTVFDDPAAAEGSSTLALASTPPTAAPGDQITIDGALSLDSGSPQGRTVEIWVGLGAEATLVDTVTTDAAGEFSAGDEARLGLWGNCYTAKFAGDAANSSSSATDTTEVDRVATTVVVDDPTPSSIAPTDEVTVTGQVTVSEIPSQDDRLLEVSRVRLSGGSTPLTDVPMNADGTFTFTDNPDQVGHIYYHVVAPENARYQSAFDNSAEVDVAKLSPVVTLTPADGHIRYGNSITVRIGIPEDTAVRNVVLTEKQVGKPKITIFDGVVPALGKSFVRSPKANATYELIWDGDARYLGATKTGTVSVHAIVTGVLRGALRQQGAYKIYRKGSIAYFPVTVTPNHGSKLVEIDLDKQVSGTWRRLATVEFHLRDSRILVLLNTGALRLGVNFRIRAVFDDADHAVGRSPFRYFRLVA